MVEKNSTRFLLLMTVIVPYLVLVGCSIAIYPDLPKEFENGMPRMIVFLPAFISIILPATFAVMIFFYGEYLKKSHLLLISSFMNVGTLGLIGAVFLVKDSA